MLEVKSLDDNNNKKKNNNKNNNNNTTLIPRHLPGHLSHFRICVSFFIYYIRVPQAAGQVKILIFLVKINFFPIYANICW